MPKTLSREPSLDSLTGKNLPCNGTIQQPDHTTGKPSCLTLNGYNHHGSETPARKPPAERAAKLCDPGLSCVEAQTTRGEGSRPHLIERAADRIWWTSRVGTLPLRPVQVCALPLPAIRRPEPTLPTRTHQPSNCDQQGTAGNHPRDQQPTPQVCSIPVLVVLGHFVGDSWVIGGWLAGVVWSRVWL